MQHVLTSVVLVALVMGCDSTENGASEDPGNSTTTHETGDTGMPHGVSAAVNGATGNSFTAGTGDAGTTTGGQVGGEGAFGGSGGEGGSDGEHGIAGEAGSPNYPENPYPAVAIREPSGKRCSTQ